uniref:Uncharacterized protein n=1 Tax=Pithovirus LCPAC103 TaxID=2506588 RepID=A0A481Z4Q0_9VIRU|nr:MAG: uncharacterized protein LCPAC103_01760 [Pithovirus LCPAC103]
MCRNDTEEEDSRSADFWFKTEQLYNDHNDDGFDMLIDDFNKWLTHNGHADWWVDDVIESLGDLTETQAINPIRIEE